MNDSQRSLLRKVLLPIESPQTVDIAELLANDLSPTFWRVVLPNIVDQQNTAMCPTLVCPFLVPLEVRAVFTLVSERGGPAVADVW